MAIAVGLVLPATLMSLPETAKATTIVIQPSEMDTSISQGNPDATNGRNTWFGVGSQPDSNSRALIKFDLTSAIIPDGEYVSSVIMYLNLVAVTEWDFDYPKVIDVYRVKTYWGEHSATWNKEPDYQAEATSSVTWPDISAFDVTDVVVGWLSGEYENYGLMLRMRYEDGDAEGDSFSVTWASKETGNWDPPKLEIDHLPIDDFVDIEIVEPMDGDTLCKGCTCPTLRSTMEYDGTLTYVRYKISSNMPLDTLDWTLPAIFNVHTGYWEATLDCTKLENIGPTYQIVVTAEAAVSGVPQDTDQITLNVENTFHLPRMAYVYYYSFPPEPMYSNFHAPPGNVYAVFEEFDGKYELFRVDIESPELVVSGTGLPMPPLAIVVAVPDNWEIATDLYGREITNLPDVDVLPAMAVPSVPPYEPPPGYTAYEIRDNSHPHFEPLCTDVTYQLWFYVKNPWYG